MKLTLRTVPSLAILGVCSAALAACADPSRPTSPPSPEATLNASEQRVVPPLPELASVTDIGEVVQNARILGRDGAISTRAFGVSLWTFGDTPLTVPNARGQNWSDNTISWSTDTDASDGITLNHDYLDAVGAPGEFIPYTAAESTYNYQHDAKHCSAQPCGAEYAFWPGGPVYDQARNRVLVPYYKLHRISGQSAWTGIGTGWLVIRANKTVTRPVVRPGTPEPTLMWDSTETAYDNASLVVGDTLFAYGCDTHFLTKRCKVAKVHLADVLTRARWRFYEGNGVWSSNPALAKYILQGGAAGTTIFYNAYLGVYMATYNGVFSDDFFMRVSYTPWGPWSTNKLIFTGRPGWGGNYNYAGQTHPEFAQQNGRVQYATYAHATGFLRWDLPIVRYEFR